MAGENPFVATFETGRHYQVHKSYVYVAPIVAVVVFVVVALMNGMQGIIQLAVAIQDGEIAVNPLIVILCIVAGVLVLVGAFVLLYWLAWKNMSYVFDEREFSFYSGIITKRRVHVPYARVQSVNHRASIVQRIFGVCTVIIDSAGGSANKGVRVPYLQLETAERMRAELFMRKAAVAAGMESAVAYGNVVPGAAPGAAASISQQPNALDAMAGAVGDWRGLYGGEAMFGEEPITHEYGLSNHELLLTTISHDTPIAVALTIGLSCIIMLAFVLLAQDAVASWLMLFAFPVIFFGTLVTWLIGMLGVLLSYGNFRARRRGSRIEVERGLLSRYSSGIDIARVQSIEVRQSFIRRIIGYCEISLGRIDAAGEQNKGNNNSKAGTKGLVIHPFVKADRVDEILDGLAPELADRPRRAECKPLPKQVLRRALFRRCLWYNWVLWIALAVGIMWGVMAVLVSNGSIVFASAASHAQYDSFMTGSLAIVIAVCAIITVLRGVGAVLWARHSGYTWNRRYLLVWNDGLSTAQSVIPRQKIQAGATRSNPFQRRLSLATLQAVTAAGTRSTVTRLIDIPQEDASSYLEWLQ